LKRQVVFALLGISNQSVHQSSNKDVINLSQLQLQLQLSFTLSVQLDVCTSLTLSTYEQEIASLGTVVSSICSAARVLMLEHQRNNAMFPTTRF